FVAYIISVLTISGCNLCEFRGWILVPQLTSAGLAVALTILLCSKKTNVILTNTRRVFSRIENSFAICAVCIALLTCISSLLISKIVLKTFPNSGDEFAYLFQSQTFLHGRIWNDPPPISGIFSPFHIIETTDIWAGKFPPGWPLIIALFSSIGVKAWIVNPALN